MQPGNETNIVAHLLRDRRDPGYSWDASQVTVASLANTWQMLDDWKDTGDFRLMYLHWILAYGPGTIDQTVLDAIEQRMIDFRYRWNDPLPANRLDHKWFWSENHIIIFAVDEYLAGQAFPSTVFTVTGLTGAQHAARARTTILEWIHERARFGFSEWHSNVYMLKNITPLLTLIELSNDAELERMATAMLDICLADMAFHTQKGAYGATRGRTYKGDKMSSVDEDTFGTAKLMFDDTAHGWTRVNDTGATYLAGAEKYRMPEVIRRIAVSDTTGVVKERHGVPINPHEEITPAVPQAAYGYTYADPQNLPFWWAQGAFTSWQMVPSTLAAADQYRLWDTDLWSEFDTIREVAAVGPELAKVAARELASMVAFEVLGEANTYTWRSPDVMLSTVINHRPGDAHNQVHSWQATIDLNALVFTNHPLRPTPQSLDWGDDDGYWTGTASQPRSVQHNNVAIHSYAPSYASPTDDLLGPTFSYLQETHAYFPQDHFDEVVQAAGWTIGRKGDGYIALWSHRPTVWRSHNPAVVATNGMVQPFDLVAEGSPRNVWITEVARAADVGSFVDFVNSITATSPSVTVNAGGVAQQVIYNSPSQGQVVFGTQPTTLSVAGSSVPVGGHQRLESTWGEVCHLGKFMALTDGDASLVVDIEKGAREVS